MKKIVLLLLLLCSVLHIHAQQITQAEALRFADKLYEKEILSQKGRDSLREAIIHKPGEDSELSFLNAETGSGKGLAKSHILYFLTQAFGSELNYRTGMTTLTHALQTDLKDNEFDAEAQKRYVKLSDSLQQQWRQTEVWKAEESLKQEEDTVSTTGHWWGAFDDPATLMRPGLGYGYIHTRRSVSGKQLTRTLTELLSIELIDSNVYRDVLSRLKDHALFLEVHVLMAATERTLFYENFDDIKAKERALMDRLERAEVLTAAGKRQLLASYKEKEIKSTFEYVRYANKAKVIQVAQVNRDPVKGYKQIMDSIGLMVPGLQMSNIKVSVHKAGAWDNELTETKATIAFDADGQPYKHTFFYNFVRGHSDPQYKPDTILHISNEFHKGINKWLADQESPLRLYYVHTGDDRSVNGNNEFGLILMNKAQAEAWGEDGYFLSSENHDNTFNTKNIAKAVALYETTGLFSHLSRRETEQGREKAGEQDINSWQSLLECFPKTLVAFDWETANLETPYQEHTKELEAASRGAFTITQIKDEFEQSLAQNKESSLFSFAMNGKTYSKQLKMESDWLDPAFLDLIEQAMIENNVKGKFYYALADGQVSGYIFLTPEQYDILHQAQPGLFPSAPERD